MINTTFSDVDGVVSATIYGLDGAVIRRLEREPALFPAGSASVSLRLPEESELSVTPVYFVLLELKRPEGGKVLSRNFYWLSRNNGDFLALQGDWRSIHVDVHVSVSGRFVPVDSGGSQGSERKVTGIERSGMEAERSGSAAERSGMELERNGIAAGRSATEPERNGKNAERTGRVKGGRYELSVEISNGGDVRGDVPNAADTCASGLEDQRGWRILVGVEKGQCAADQESCKHQSDVISDGEGDEGPDVRYHEGRQRDDESASGIAFWLHVGVLKASEKVVVGSSHSKYVDPRVLPVHYSDNYLSLVPGEAKRVTVEFKYGLGKSSEHPSILVEGWNVRRTVLQLKAHDKC